MDGRGFAGGHWSKTVRLLEGARGRWFYLAIRIALGAAFVYAGAVKVTDPLQFADNVASFELVPNVFVSPFALSLPIFEMIAGFLLVIGFWRHAASLGIVILCVVFVVAVASALARGLTIDCGCFGTSEPSRAKMWFDLARDMVLLLAALMVYLQPSNRKNGAWQEPTTP
jgi:putative oxidoreductase